MLACAGWFAPHILPPHSDLLGYVEVRELCVLFDEIHRIAVVFDEADREGFDDRNEIRLVSYVHFARASLWSQSSLPIPDWVEFALRFWLVEAIQPWRIVELEPATASPSWRLARLSTGWDLIIRLFWYRNLEGCGAALDKPMLDSFGNGGTAS